MEKTPDAAFDAQVRVYLVEMFVVADAAEGRAELKWVGRQVEEETLKGDDPRMTLFFEVSLPKGPAGVTLRNQLFCELFEDQSNLVFLRLGTHRQQVRFEPGSAAVDLGGP